MNTRWRGRRLVAGLALALPLALAACGTESDGSGADGGAEEPAAAPTDLPVPAGEVQGMGMVLDDRSDPGPPVFCLGAVAESWPPQCDGDPLANWSWKGVKYYDKASGVWFGSYVVTGTFDGTTFTVTKKPVSSAIWDPMPSEEPTDPLATRCEEPAGGWQIVDRSKTDFLSLDAAFQTAVGLPGYTASWIDSEGGEGEDSFNPKTTILNVLVTEDIPGAERSLRGHWGGLLCIAPATRTLAELEEMATELQDLPGVISAGADQDRVELTVLYDDGSLQDYVDSRYEAGLVEVESALTPL